MGALIHDAWTDFARSWKRLALTSIAYGCVAFMVLTPLVGILFRTFLATARQPVLADQDILFFFMLSPIGWITLVVVGSLSVGIAMLSQAALLLILGSAAHESLGVLAALRLTAARARPVVLLTARLLMLSLLAVAPFVLAIGATYLLLLGEYDINFYLSEKPPAFWVAATIAGVAVAGLAAVLLRLASSWLFALPIVVFEQAGPGAALRSSWERSAGGRVWIVLWLCGWFLASAALSGVITFGVVFFGRLIVPYAAKSLALTVVAVGGSLIAWTGSNLAASLFSTTLFSSLIFNLYLRFGGEPPAARAGLATQASATGGLRLTRRRVLAGLIAGMLISGLVGAAAVGTLRLQDRVQIMAHRGASSAAPENTLAAIRQAIEDGADWVEIDVQETADGEVVVFHDSDFMKLAGVDLKIWDATAEDLKDIDIGSWFGPEYADQRVPTLAEVLELCNGRIGVNIELKYYGHDQRLEERVVEVVEAAQLRSEFVIMALSVPAVKKVKALRPSWNVGLLMSVAAGNLGRLDLDFLAVNAKFVNWSFVRSAHRMNRKVYVWTVNDPVSMSTMIGCGVDAMITDKPALARSVLRQRAELSVSERLLLELADLLGVARELGEQ